MRQNQILGESNVLYKFICNHFDKKLWVEILAQHRLCSTGERYKIDTIMITKNAVHPCLKESLDSIFRNIPVHCLIVVDSMSTDGTTQLIRNYQKRGVRVRIIQQDCKRGKAREIGIKEVDTEWFAFVDSDVILAENWFRKIERYIEPRVGAIEGNVRTPAGEVQKIRPTDRAYTNCTLIRTSSVEGIKIPREMSVYEDQFIRKYIEKKGFQWLKVPDPCSIHISTSDRLKDAFEIGRMSGKYKLFPFWGHAWSLFIVLVKKLLGKPVSPAIHWNTVRGHIKGVLER